MPQLAAVTLTDRTPVTPVARTFVPRDVVNGVGAVVYNAGLLIGEQRATISMKKVGARYKGEFRLTLPVVATETINGVSSPKILRTNYIECKVSWDERSPLQERDDAVGMMSNALGVSKALINDAFVKCEGVF
jgi:hypothetical protein